MQKVVEALDELKRLTPPWFPYPVPVPTYPMPQYVPTYPIITCETHTNVEDSTCATTAR